MSFFKKMVVNKPNCVKCGLHSRCISPKMDVSGEGKQGILIISTAPTEEEDREARHFAGSSGDIIRRTILQNHMILDRDCWVVNAVNCRTYKADGKLDDPAKYIPFCRPYIESVLREKKPSKIILLGQDAISSFYSNRDISITFDKSNGVKFWDSTYNAWVFTTFHPIDLLKFKNDRAMHTMFQNTIQDALSHTTKPLEKKFIPYKKLVVFEEVIDVLRDIYDSSKIIAIDYETTGVNLMQTEHKTACVGMATKDMAYSFLYQHPYYSIEQQEQIGEWLKKILKTRKIKKVVHNLQFEYPWSRYIIGQSMNGLTWDTMLGAHLLDNRQGITRLKYQAFQRWGIPEYDSDIKQFLEVDPRTGYNNVMKIPVDKLLEYNALDVVYTMALYKEQILELSPREKAEAYPLFHKASIIFSEMSYNGMRIDHNFYEQERAKLVAERDGLIQELNNFREVQLFVDKYKTEFNMDSPKHMQDLLFVIMGMTSKKKTSGGDNSVDADVLSKIDHPITRAVLKIRKLNKVIGTYIDSFAKLCTGDYLHPSFLLHIARSFRSSSKNPNFQNTPKRDKQANRAVRSGMVPEDGCVLVEGDFSGAEIVTSCTYHLDPTFIKYQMDDNADMHRDAAARIWMAENIVSKPVRQAIKSGFTFSQFYGSYYVSCAIKMWEEMLDMELTNGVKLRDHIAELDLLDFVFSDGTTLKGKLAKELAAKNIRIEDLTLYERFEFRVRAFEQQFWNEWFPIYTKWKKEIFESYLKNGYIETHFGFRFRGYMDRKQAANYPIQGTSFHMLLYSLIKLDAELKIRGMKTKLVGQIHDSIIAQVPVDELDQYCEIFTGIVDNLQNELPWLCIPMRAEIEVSKTREEGGSFAEMKKIVG